MKRTSHLALVLGALAILTASLHSAPLARPTVSPKKGKRMLPFQLHPDNPRYFLFRGKPTVLVTSAEHYGAVLNLDFQPIPYLDTLQRDGMNMTRIFSGFYCENPGAFNIKDNTLAPLPGRLICPWARSNQPGYAGGGNRFDLSRWDDAYFTRLRQYVEEAGKRGIVVEVALFCPFYEDSMWNLSPVKAGNNIQGVGEVPRNEVLTLKHPELVAVQDAMTRKIAQELAPLDNWYFEICNEPYAGKVPLDWEHHVADTIRAAEPDPTTRHLIAQNISNGSAKVENPHPAVSLFNFHYAAPPDAVKVNAHLKRAIGDDETGFRGTTDLPYRTEGWDFMLAGGAHFNNLDYSFTAAHPDGKAEIGPTMPGGGGPSLRRSLRALREFMESLPFLKMSPDEQVVRGGVTEGTTARVLSEPGKVYALYLKGGSGQPTLELALSVGHYQAEWINPRTGATAHSEAVESKDGVARLKAPPYTEDIALRVRRK